MRMHKNYILTGNKNLIFIFLGEGRVSAFISSENSLAFVPSGFYILTFIANTFAHSLFAMSV